ncbi:hypothetical protein [Chryseobacterium binzhouense]|uniref:hypothetical protein n=1 Tax=Chryseobacterium binzhouense TaxID=2593646 RepID=UPI00289E4220|nr:hypothetical protein [Chryseobacterium binzhouense]
MDTIFLINKSYIDEDDILIKIEKVAQNLNLKYTNEEYDLILTTVEFDDYITFGGLSLGYFNETLQGNNFIDGYGCEMSIEYRYESTILLPFLKEFLKEYPDMLIYKETGKALNNPFVFNKNHLENFSGTDSYAFLGNPPQDLSNLA